MQQGSATTPAGAQSNGATPQPELSASGTDADGDHDGTQAAASANLNIQKLERLLQKVQNDISTSFDIRTLAQGLFLALQQSATYNPQGLQIGNASQFLLSKAA